MATLERHGVSSTQCCYTGAKGDAFEHLVEEYDSEEGEEEAICSHHKSEADN